MLIKKRFWEIASLGLSVLAMLMLRPTWGMAATSPDNNIGFSVVAKRPTNQLDSSHSFFDLKMQSGQTQTLKAVIYNVTKHELKIKMGIHTAYTNTNGVIEYVNPGKTFDSSMKYQLGQLTQVKRTDVVIVPPNSAKVVEAEVKIPRTNFQGVMLGGWYFEKDDDKVTSTVSGAMTVRNHYSYVIGLKYTMGEVPKPELKLGKVAPGLANARQAVVTELRNVSAVLVPAVNLETTITHKATGKVVKSAKRSNVQLAPNTVFKQPILTGTAGLIAGQYRLRLVAKNKDHRWVFQKDFTITKLAAKETAKRSVENKGLNPMWLVAAGAMGMLLLGSLILWLWHLVKKNKRNES
ncbi:DUF916 and DUF3324 domain-containing protein [Lactiplantibacillus pingfangensis]|uniref:DUF916 and DUF3324 domain-containing protein n=1 Tax=Lactiplantibacillus pingfangensis TaxID=2559915 RepID=UPI0010F84A86|nr:DUF916 and DUF3324 domain-containing protein [Lactiplantibacillus pingfangensis]